MWTSVTRWSHAGVWETDPTRRACGSLPVGGVGGTPSKFQILVRSSWTITSQRAYVGMAAASQLDPATARAELVGLISTGGRNRSWCRSSVNRADEEHRGGCAQDADRVRSVGDLPGDRRERRGTGDRRADRPARACSVVTSPALAAGAATAHEGWAGRVGVAVTAEDPQA